MGDWIASLCLFELPGDGGNTLDGDKAQLLPLGDFLLVCFKLGSKTLRRVNSIGCLCSQCDIHCPVGYKHWLSDATCPANMCLNLKGKDCLVSINIFNIYRIIAKIIVSYTQISVFSFTNILLHGTFVQLPI